MIKSIYIYFLNMSLLKRSAKVGQKKTLPWKKYVKINYFYYYKKKPRKSFSIPEVLDDKPPSSPSLPRVLTVSHAAGRADCSHFPPCVYFIVGRLFLPLLGAIAHLDAGHFGAVNLFKANAVINWVRLWITGHVFFVGILSCCCYGEATFLVD